MKSAVNDQHLGQIKTQLNGLDATLDQLQKDIQSFSFVRFVPHLKFYYQDSERILAAGKHGLAAAHILIDGLEPFASVLGLSEDVEDVSAQEKIAQLAQVAPSLLPSVEAAQNELNFALAEIEQLRPQIYPQEIKGIAIRSELTRLKENLPQLQSQLGDIKPLLQELPSLMGVTFTRNYLILFQNDMELRPTGGFITAYAIAQMENGKFSIIASDDIYSLDNESTFLSIPEPILYHLKVSGFFMRDTNFSPDFKKSMQDFQFYYDRIGNIPIDGIVALDTHFVEALLKLSGPISVPGYSLDFGGFPNLPESCKAGGGEFTAENVICRLELYAQKVYLRFGDRKAILGELMGKMVDWALNTPSEQWPELIKLAGGQLGEKHLLIYLHNEKAQGLAEKYNWAGRIQETSEHSDYLHINQANLAGLKSDMYMRRNVKYQVDAAEDGTLTAKLTLTMRNTGAYDGWLNSTARNYLRIYVPLGSELIAHSGGEYLQPQVFEDLGKTVLSNFVLTRPLSESILAFEYKLPFKFEPGQGFDTNQYELLIQKQPGLDAPEYEVGVGDYKALFSLTSDKLVVVEL